MGWNYQIVKHEGEHPWYGLHEVYRHEGKTGWTESPIKFVADIEEGPEGIIKALEMALDDARNMPVILPTDEG